MSFAAWIKIETTTPDKPEVIAMATRLGKSDPDLIVGKLVRLWSWADANSVDGRGMTITRAWIDRFTGLKGFAKALENVGWLSGPDGAIEFANFDRHNGDSAKRRAMETRKKQRQRGGQMSRSDRDKPGDQEIELELGEREHARSAEEARCRGLVNSLKPEWAAAPVFGAEEERLFQKNFDAIAALPPEAWPRMQRYMAAKLKDGSGYWQPRHKHKLIESITEVACQSENWERKLPQRPAPKPADPKPPDEPLSPEAMDRILHPERYADEGGGGGKQAA